MIDKNEPAAEMDITPEYRDQDSNLGILKTPASLPIPRPSSESEPTLNLPSNSQATNIRDTWMWTYRNVGSLKITETILPGTHNSGFDKEAPYTPSGDTCQDVSTLKQLLGGIRVLDLRVQFFGGLGSGDARRFSIFHSTTSGRTVQEILQNILTFHQANRSKEIIIVNFHQFKNFTTAAHTELASLIKNAFSQSAYRSKLITPNLKSMTINNIWQRNLNENVVIAYNTSNRDSAFWPGVNQRWIGENTPSTAKLKSFMDRVAQESKPQDELRSIQCAKYSLPFHVPKNLSGDINTWFKAGESKNAYIQKFFIINTDWSLRSNLVDDCIYANYVKTR
ncbi:hypothetical protein [Pseudomonas akapageensis]|uniref:hypothetical protein n=1 Tax=Pseudomonas akapageensis TaxID=2609961 RepID=UPI00140E2F55|nr:hypothetical protein [Pseudomonas akapageensis]